MTAARRAHGSRWAWLPIFVVCCLALILALAPIPPRRTHSRPVGEPAGGATALELHNDLMTLSVSKAGTWSLTFKDGTRGSLTDVGFRLEGPEVEGSLGDYDVAMHEERVEEQLGEFERATINFNGNGRFPDLTYTISLSTSRPEVVVKLDLVNTTPSARNIRAIWPLVVLEKKSGLEFAGSLNDWVAVKTEDFYGSHRIVRGPYFLANVVSHLIAANKPAGRAFLIGFLSHRKGVGYVSTWWDEYPIVRLAARILYAAPSIPVPPGGKIEGERLLLSFGADGLDTLERFADLIALEHDVNPKRDRPLDERSVYFHTWKNEFGSYIMLDRLVGRDGGEAAKQEQQKLEELGLVKYGYLSRTVAWKTIPVRIRSALCLARRQGRSDIWAALSKDQLQALRHDHPGWFLPHRADYVMDFSNPEVVEFERNRAQRWAGRPADLLVYQDDFLHEWAYFPDQHDPFQTVPEMLRNAISVWRCQRSDAWGLAYINRFYLCYGLWDIVRVGMDSDRGYVEPHGGSFVGECLPMVAQRYFFNGRVWWNNPDSYHVYVQGDYSHGEAKAHATFCAFAANVLMLGEPLSQEEMPADRLDIIKRVSPAGMDIARPIDYFDRELPAVWHMPIGRPFGEWDLLALFAYLHDQEDFHVDLEELGLSSDAEYLVYEFWSDEFKGVVKGHLSESLKGPDCAVYSIVPKRDHPQLVSTNRHIRHMANDIAALSWDEEQQALKGTSRVMADEYYELRIHLPEGLRPREVVLPEPYKVEQETEGDILKVGFTPAMQGEVNWQVLF